VSRVDTSHGRSKSVTPGYLIKGVFLILVLASLWSIILPGIVAWNDQVFYDHQIVSKMPPTARRVYDDYAKQKAAVDALIIQLTSSLGNGRPTSQSVESVKALLDVQKQIQGTKGALRAEIHPFGFFGDNVNTVFVLYFILTGTLYLISPRYTKYPNLKGIFITGVTTYFLVGWPNYFRNFAFTEYLPLDFAHGRTVYSYVHWDIDKYGFLLQEVRILSMFLLSAALWQIWIKDFKTVRDFVKAWSDQPVDVEMFSERAGALGEEFSRWQVHSLLLVGGFLCWTYFFGIRSPVSQIIVMSSPPFSFTLFGR